MVNNNNYRLRVKPAGLGAGFVILVIYFIFEYVRPQSSLLPVLSYVRIPMVLSIVLFAVFLKGDKKMLYDRLVILTVLFIAEIGVSVLYAENTYYVWSAFFGMIIILLAIILPMPTICNSKEKLATFFNIWIWIHVVVAVYSLFHSGHGPGGFLLDENDMSLTFNMVLPISIYSSMSPNITKSRKVFYRLASLLFIVCIGFTMSRGGFLGLLSVFGFMWLLSENRAKTFFKVLMIIVVFAFPIYKMIPETYITEMSTITNTEDSTRVARQYFWTKGWEMFLDNPVLGVGANNFPWNIARYQLRDPNFDIDTMSLYGGRPAHSLYFTLIPELGAVGIAIFLLILYQIFMKLMEIIRLSKANGSVVDELLLAKAIIVSTVTFLVTGAFISVLYYPPFWYLIGFTLTIYNVVCPQNVSQESNAVVRRSSNTLKRTLYEKVDR